MNWLLGRSRSFDPFSTIIVTGNSKEKIRNLIVGFCLSLNEVRILFFLGGGGVSFAATKSIAGDLHGY